jgi:hypothetical protein
MFVLVQRYGLQAGDDQDTCPFDVVAVDPSREQLEAGLTAYQERYRAACSELATWDADWPTDDDTDECCHKHDELMLRHGVHGALIPEAVFEIREVLGSLDLSTERWRRWAEQERTEQMQPDFGDSYRTR